MFLAKVTTNHGAPTILATNARRQIWVADFMSSKTIENANGSFG